MCVPGTKKKKIRNKLLLWPAALYNIGLQKLAATAAQKICSTPFPGRRGSHKASSCLTTVLNVSKAALQKRLGMAICC